jgi:hypothetical protein
MEHIKFIIVLFEIWASSGVEGHSSLVECYAVSTGKRLTMFRSIEGPWLSESKLQKECLDSEPKDKNRF